MAGRLERGVLADDQGPSFAPAARSGWGGEVGGKEGQGRRFLSAEKGTRVAAAAMSPDTSAAAARHAPAAWRSQRPPVGRQAAQARVGHPALRDQVRPQCHRARRR